MEFELHAALHRPIAGRGLPACSVISNWTQLAAAERYRVREQSVDQSKQRQRETQGCGMGEAGRRQAAANGDAMATMIPLGRGGTPDEAADAIYLFRRPESNYISR